MRTQALVTESEARSSGIAVDWPNGEHLGNWRVLAPLGRGGTAEVWHAVAADGREAALKLPKPELRRHAGANALIRREHDLLRSVASPHLVEPYELIDCDGVAVLALEYLSQGDLVSMLGAPLRQWLPAFRTVLSALVALERHGFAHGDVKARNVLFAADGSARLADLALARPLDAPAAAATAAYGPPARSGVRAHEADCFALAALLFELLTAQLPYGPDGASADGAEPTPAALAEPEAARLLAAAIAALRAQGRGLGFSYFGDVIESVRFRHG
jgi:eukaryotic-like serine/threonine-protein kinase